MDYAPVPPTTHGTGGPNGTRISSVRASVSQPAASSALTSAWLAVGETVILLHPPLPLLGVSIVMERERQQNDSLARGYPGAAHRHVALGGVVQRGVSGLGGLIHVDVHPLSLRSAPGLRSEWRDWHAQEEAAAATRT